MNRIYECRERLNLSQKQVAMEIGVKPPTVSQWESGIKNPSRQNVAKLALLFGVSSDYLLGVVDSFSNDGSEFSAEEIKLIHDYRALNNQGKEYIRQTMYMALSIYIEHDNISGMEAK